MPALSMIRTMKTNEVVSASGGAVAIPDFIPTSLMESRPTLAMALQFWTPSFHLKQCNAWNRSFGLLGTNGEKEPTGRTDLI